MSTSGRSVVPVLPFEWLKLVVERTRDPLPPDPPLLFGEGEPGDLRTGLGVKLIAFVFNLLHHRPRFPKIIFAKYQDFLHLIIKGVLLTKSSFLR